MPNWVKNKVNFSGPPEDIAELARFVKTEDEFTSFDHTLNGDYVSGQLFSFKKIIPYEGDWDSAVCLKLWGTKWDAIEVNASFHGDFVCYKFKTAWVAPYPIYHALNNKFKDIYISWFYHEPQMEMAGYINVENEQKKYKEKQHAI
jgi:hypothetical protein